MQFETLSMMLRLGSCRRAEIELCSRLLSVSAHGLHDNPGLVFFVIVAQVLPFDGLRSHERLCLFCPLHG